MNTMHPTVPPGIKVVSGTLPFPAGVAVFDASGVEYGRVAWKDVAAHYDAQGTLVRIDNTVPVLFPMTTVPWPPPIAVMRIYLPFGGEEVTHRTMPPVLLYPGATLLFHPGTIVVEGAAALALLGGYTNYPRDGERVIDVPAPRLVLP